MNRLLPTLIISFLLIPNIAYCRGALETYLEIVIIGMGIGPYVLLSMLPYFIQKKNKGRNIFLSIMTYVLSLGGILLANYHIYRFAIPGSDLGEEDGVFYLMTLPFVIVILLAAKKDYNFSKIRKEQY